MNSHCVSCWTKVDKTDTVCGACHEDRPTAGWLWEDLRGKRLDKGRYELLEPIGFGGFGCVARGRQWCGDVLLGNVAIKFPHPNTVDCVDPAAFFREAEAIRKVQHPGIVVLHDAFLDNGIPFLVMELVESYTPLVPQLSAGETILWIGIQVADAIDELNRKGVVHCDIKPGNIATKVWLSDLRPFVKVLDFGLATVWTKGSGYESFGGTPGFAPPDQIEGKISPLCDVFAHGVLMYWMFSHQLPYDPKLFYSPVEFAKAPPPQSLENVPPELDSLIQSCLHLDPRRRYPRMPTAPLLDILKTASADLSPQQIDTDAMLRQAKDLFIKGGLAKGREQKRLYERSAQLFDELARVQKLPKAYLGHAQKARAFATKNQGFIERLFGK